LIDSSVIKCLLSDTQKANALIMSTVQALPEQTNHIKYTRT